MILFEKILEHKKEKPGLSVASHAGVFRDEKRAPLKTPAWEARLSANQPSNNWAQ